MPFTFVLPQSNAETIMMLAPIVTVLLGLAFLLMPKRMLAVYELEAKPSHPDATAEGRATYAGALLGFGLCCVLLQEPRALQPGLNTMLGVAWFISAFGFVLHMIVDGRSTFTLLVSVLGSVALGALALEAGDNLRFGLVEPRTAQEWIYAGIGILTLILGLIALLMPNLALRIMRLQAIENAGSGQTRGILAGFYISAGLGVLFASEPAVAILWLQIVLGAVWLLTGLGRCLAMVLDPKLFKGISFYNLFGAIFELSLGGYVLGSIFGLI